jgi:hypothetical protein
MSCPKEDIVAKYTDDEGDVVIITTDQSLKDAVEYVHSTGASSLKLAVEMTGAAAAMAKGDVSKSNQNMIYGAASVAAVALVATSVFVFLRPKNS